MNQNKTRAQLLIQLMTKTLDRRSLPMGNDFTFSEEIDEVIDIDECELTIEDTRSQTAFLNDTCKVGSLEWRYIKAYFGLM